MCENARKYTARTNIIGSYNVYNVLSAVKVLNLLGFNLEELVLKIKNLKQIEGRFNKLKFGENCNIIINYAHTEDALEKIIRQIKSLSANKLITVFGCPGNRDEYKRSKMGEISALLSDETIITTDNPALENPLFIIKEIEKGIKKHTDNYFVVENRRDAVEMAISKAILTGNCNILLAGKGSEE